MFGKYTYLYYTLIFTIPLILILTVVEFNLLKKYFKIIMATTLFLTFYGLILWQVALSEKLWWYDSEKILEITFLGTMIENIIWWFLITFLISFFAIVATDRVDKKISKDN